MLVKSVFKKIALGMIVTGPLSQFCPAQTSSTSQGKENQKQTQTTKKDKKRTTKAKKDKSSKEPMSEQPPVPLHSNPGQPETPAIPPRTPGQQPAPGSPDPTAPTTAPQR